MHTTRILFASLLFVFAFTFANVETTNAQESAKTGAVRYERDHYGQVIEITMSADSSGNPTIPHLRYLSAEEAAKLTPQNAPEAPAKLTTEDVEQQKADAAKVEAPVSVTVEEPKAKKIAPTPQRRRVRTFSLSQLESAVANVVAPLNQKLDTAIRTLNKVAEKDEVGKKVIETNRELTAATAEHTLAIREHTAAINRSEADAWTRDYYLAMLIIASVLIYILAKFYFDIRRQRDIMKLEKMNSKLKRRMRFVERTVEKAVVDEIYRIDGELNTLRQKYGKIEDTDQPETAAKPITAAPPAEIPSRKLYAVEPDSDDPDDPTIFHDATTIIEPAPATERIGTAGSPTESVERLDPATSAIKMTDTTTMEHSPVASPLIGVEIEDEPEDDPDITTEPEDTGEIVPTITTEAVLSEDPVSDEILREMRERIATGPLPTASEGPPSGEPPPTKTEPKPGESFGRGSLGAAWK